MFRPYHVAAVVASLLLQALPAFGQAVEVLPGSRVRFTANGIGSGVTVLVLERHGDTLRVIQGKGAPFDIRLSELSTLRLSLGRSRAAGAGVGALWGAGINVTTAALLLAAGAKCDECETDIDGPALGLSIASGAFTGALIGALIGREMWADVSLPMQASVRPVVSRDLLPGGGTKHRIGIKVKIAT